MKKSFLGPLLLLVSLAACRKAADGDTNAMQDRSWFKFKNGVDRFYLAYPEYGGYLLGGPEKNGWEVLVGLACYGESADPKAMVPDNETGKMIPLNMRERLSQFLVVGPTATPGSGKCQVILGDPYSPARWNVKVDESVYSRANITMMGAASSCLGMAASVLTIAAATTGAAAATPATLGASAVAWSAVTAPMWIGLSTSSLGCFSGAGNLALMRPEVAKNKSYADLLQGLAKAEAIAMEELKEASFRGSTQYERLQQLRYNARLDGSKLLKAVALFNPVLVRAFNQKVQDTFEQGWFNGNNFFKSIQDIKADIGASVSPVNK